MRNHGVKLVLIAGEGKDVGKTLLGERLTAELRSRGLSVGVVKHVHHGVDYRVKDTGRYLGAGAKRIIAVGPREYMLVEVRRLSLRDAVCLVSDSDVIIVEGFREHIGEALSLGGCTVFIRKDGSIEMQGNNRRAKVRGIGEALEKLLRFLVSNVCLAQLPCGEKASQKTSES